MGKLTKADFPEAWNGYFRPAVTTCRCPKCKSRTLRLTEQVEAFTTFDVVDGRLNREGGIHEFGGFAGSLTARCMPCGHQWTVRKAQQIEDAVVELDPKTFEPLFPTTPTPDKGEDQQS